MKNTCGPGRGARGAEEARLLGAAAHRHQERRPDRLEVRLGVAHGAVEREDRQHVEPGGLLEAARAR